MNYTSAHTGLEIDAAIENANEMLATGAADPTTATVGTLGQIYKNTTTGVLFRCTTINGTTYTWEALAPAPFATTSAKGVVQIGDNLDIADGVLSLPDTITAGSFAIAHTEGSVSFAEVIESDAVQSHYIELSGSGFGDLRISTGVGGRNDTPPQIQLVEGESVTPMLTFGNVPGSIVAGAKLNMGSHLINSVTDPVSAQDAATKAYVDAKIAAIMEIINAL